MARDGGPSQSSARCKASGGTTVHRTKQAILTDVPIAHAGVSRPSSRSAEPAGTGARASWALTSQRAARGERISEHARPRAVVRPQPPSASGRGHRRRPAQLRVDKAVGYHTRDPTHGSRADILRRHHQASGSRRQHQRPTAAYVPRQSSLRGKVRPAPAEWLSSRHWRQDGYRIRGA